MNTPKHLAASLAAAMGLLALTGCSQSQPARLANERAFSLDGITEVTISYDEEAVTFCESENGELTIREYMTEDKSSYYVRVEESGGSIKLSEGGKPLFHGGFTRYIEVCLPASYREDLTVTTTDGDIDLARLAPSLRGFRVDSTSGTVRLGAVEAQSIHLSTTSGALEAERLEADTIRVDTTSGSFSCETLAGDVSYTTTSGSADVRSARGCGNYRANNSGDLDVVYTEVTGDLSFFNKNDGIRVTLPAGLEFSFEAVAKNGSVSTSFQECLSTVDGTTSGTVGEHPTVSVKTETNNGKIEVIQ